MIAKLAPEVVADAQRILSAAARRILAEQIAARKAAA